MKKASMTMWLLAVAILMNAGLGHAAPAANAPKPVKSAVSADLPVVNINKADLEELETIKGIGPALAERIIAYRNENGNFKSAEDLMSVKGIGEAKFERIRGQITA